MRKVVDNPKKKSHMKEILTASYPKTLAFCGKKKKKDLSLLDLPYKGSEFKMNSE